MIQANIDYIKHTGQELQELSGQIEGLVSELEEVKRELKKQTVFDVQIRELTENKNRMTEERYQLRILAQAISSIGNLYQRTENAVEAVFEVQKPEFIWRQTGYVDLAGFGEEVNHLLYGGEGKWQR